MAKPVISDWVISKQEPVRHGGIRTLIPRQIQDLRNTPNIQGAAYFSSQSFFKSSLGWNDSLRNHFYRYPALVPPIVGITGEKTPLPQIINPTISDNRILNFSVIPPNGTEQPIRQVGLYARYTSKGKFEDARLIEVRPFADTVHFNIEQPEEAEHATYYLTYVNPENNESMTEKGEPVSLRLMKRKNGHWILDK